MTERPKLETVAKEAGVSIATASQVMRGAGRISEATRQKVMGAAKKLRYVPNGRAAAMRSGQSREIGFVIHHLSNPFNAEVVSGVSDLLDSEGYLVSVLDARGDAARQGRQLEAFIRNGRDGLLWVPANETPKAAFDLLATQRIPTVAFMRRPEDPRFDYVGVRNAEATAAAARSLFELGHRHIAFLGGIEMNAVRRARISGCMEEAARRGAPAPVVQDCPDAKADGLRAMLTLLSEHPQITGVVCNGDMVAIGACLALAQMGLTPGREVSVIGFDDIADAALVVPPLSTMAINPYQLGRRLARVLLERIGDPEAPATATEVSAQLVMRATTGAA